MSTGTVAPQVQPGPITVANRYQISETVLGRGAWSAVRACQVIPPYRPPNTFDADGTQPSVDNMELVAKIISKAHVTQLCGGDAERAHADVVKEVEVLRLLPPHPNVARFMEFLEDEHNYYIIFEAAPKGDLCELVLQAPDRRIAEPQAKQFTVEIIRAVLHCHRHGTAHRDIKPENLLVGAGNVLKLTDFGLAKVARPDPSSISSGKSRPYYDFLHCGVDDVPSAMYPSRLWVGDSGLTPPPKSSSAATSTVPNPHAAPYSPGHMVVGTLRYGAPEMFQAKFERGVFDSFGADTWSVGVVVYIMLTGSFPFSTGSDAGERETYKTIVETPLSPPSYLSPAATDFLLRILVKNPEKRMTLWEALDHRWLRDVVERNESAIRSTLRFRRTEPTDDGHTFITAPPATIVPPAVLQLRSAIEAACAAKSDLPASDAEALKSAFDEVVSAFDTMYIATARLRGIAQAATSAAGPSPAPTTITSSRRSLVPSAPASGRSNSGSKRDVTPSGGRTATPTGTHSRPISPAVRRVAPLPSPGVRQASPANNGSNTPTSTASGAAPRTLTPTRRAVPAPGGPLPGSLLPPARRSGTPTSTTSAPRRTESPMSKKALLPAQVTVQQPATASRRTSSAGRAATPPTQRNASPLARASPVARRGTPARSVVAGTAAVPSSAAGPRRAPPAPPLNGGGAPAAAATSAASSIAVGAPAKYKDSKAVVRFIGETTFAGGQWVGLEMLEGNEGIHDGTSSVDKRRYFSCPNGRGVFVRPSQIQL